MVSKLGNSLRQFLCSSAHKCEVGRAILPRSGAVRLASLSVGLGLAVGSTLAANLEAEEKAAEVSEGIYNPRDLSWDFHEVGSNKPCEDGCGGKVIQLNDGQNILLTYMFDGHGGAKAMQFLMSHFLSIFEATVAEYASIDEHEDTIDPSQVVQSAIVASFERADTAFEEEARRSIQAGSWNAAHVGACVLAACVTDSEIIVGNCGDCRALVAVREYNQDRTSSVLKAVQLSHDHNAREAREKLRFAATHPDDPNAIVEYEGNVCYVKGALQATRSIGDFNLKSAEFNNALPPVYRIGEPFQPPYITATPEMCVIGRKSSHEFLVIATDGLFDELSNDEVVRVVDRWRRRGGGSSQSEAGRTNGAASERLTSAALRHAANDIGISTARLLSMPQGARRRNLHDDITAIVVHFT